MSNELESRLQAIEWQQNEIRRLLYSQKALRLLDSVMKRPRMYPEFRSQYGEDMLAWDMCGNAMRGVCVEVGGFDGKSLSATYALDAIGWKSILIEANRARHEEALEHRPGAHCVWSAVGAPGSPPQMEFTSIEGGGMFSGLSSNHVIEPSLKAASMPCSSVQVPCNTMDAILLAAIGHYTQLDVVVIDVEGGEVDALKGFTLQRWRPRVVFVEDNSFGEDKSLDPFFAESYQLYGFLGCNRIYGRKDDKQVWRFMNPTA